MTINQRHVTRNPFNSIEESSDYKTQARGFYVYIPSVNFISCANFKEDILRNKSIRFRNSRLNLREWIITSSDAAISPTLRLCNLVINL